MSPNVNGGNTWQEDFLILAAVDVNTNIILVFKFTNVFYVYQVLDSRHV